MHCLQNTLLCSKDSLSNWITGPLLRMELFSWTLWTPISSSSIQASESLLSLYPISLLFWLGSIHTSFVKLKPNFDFIPIQKETKMKFSEITKRSQIFHKLQDNPKTFKITLCTYLCLLQWVHHFPAKFIAFLLVLPKQTYERERERERERESTCFLWVEKGRDWDAEPWQPWRLIYGRVLFLFLIFLYVLLYSMSLALSLALCMQGRS